MCLDQTNYLPNRFFALGLRKDEWAVCYKNIHESMKDGGYFQHVETTAMVNNQLLSALCGLCGVTDVDN